MTRLVVTLFSLGMLGCASVSKGDVEELKPTAETFHQRMRWKDFRGAAELIVLEKRGAFLKARSKLNDDRDLFVSNVELEDAQIAPDLMSATLVSKISWYRLPDATEKTVTVENRFIWRDLMWQLESQDEGPFDELKPAPKKEAALDAGSTL